MVSFKTPLQPMFIIKVIAIFQHALKDNVFLTVVRKSKV